MEEWRLELEEELVEKWHDNIDQLEAIRKYLNSKLVEFLYTEIPLLQQNI